MKKMNKLIFACMTLLIAVCFVAVTDNAAWAKAQTTCPVMGGPVNKSVYTDYKGKRVYFCCNACPEPFKKDPDKYIKKMESEGIELEKVPGADKK